MLTRGNALVGVFLYLWTKSDELFLLVSSFYRKIIMSQLNVKKVNKDHKHQMVDLLL